MMDTLLPLSLLCSLTCVVACSPAPPTTSSPTVAVAEPGPRPASDGPPAVNSASAAAPPGRCTDVQSCLTKCEFCNPEFRHYATNVLTACNDGCPPLVATKNKPTVTSRMHGMVVGGAAADAYGRCRELGGDWIISMPAETKLYTGMCSGAPGPWGLEADWWVVQDKDKLSRVEMRFSTGDDETPADVAHWVAHLVSQEFGPPNHVDATSYSWTPDSGVYWSVIVDEKDGAVLFAKEQL
jgi:hypothetical protein